LQYVDGSTSCNCKGWTRRTAVDGTRTCKHTRLVDLGKADLHSTAQHTYQPIKPNQLLHENKSKLEIKLGQRKFAV
jgi:hypothetical protein